MELLVPLHKGVPASLATPAHASSPPLPSRLGRHPAKRAIPTPTPTPSPTGPNLARPLLYDVSSTPRTGTKTFRAQTLPARLRADKPRTLKARIPSVARCVKQGLLARTGTTGSKTGPLGTVHLPARHPGDAARRQAGPARAPPRRTGTMSSRVKLGRHHGGRLRGNNHHGALQTRRMSKCSATGRTTGR